MLFVWIYYGFPRVSHHLQGTLPSLSELISKKKSDEKIYIFSKITLYIVIIRKNGPDDVTKVYNAEKYF